MKKKTKYIEMNKKKIEKENYIRKENIVNA